MNPKLKQADKIIKNGGIVVMPTDTIFGMLASAFNKEAVERLYQLRQRDLKKPFIVLCSSIDDLKQLHVRLDSATKATLEKIWPNPVSVILPCMATSMSYLHRGTQTLAIRIPKKKSLQDLLKITGPVVAPSANPSGEPPAKTIKEARAYFGEAIDLYISGKTHSKPSTLITIHNGSIEILRAGDWQISQSIQ